jgi:CheY-like chemotaxis protein
MGSILDDIVIVIVDDHDDIRLFLSEYLMRRGAVVFACSNAVDALETVRNQAEATDAATSWDAARQPLGPAQ